MKKSMSVLFFMAVCSAFFFSVSAPSPNADRIELSRLGGTTRAAGEMGQAVAVVEAYNSPDAVSVSVKNYRGSARVEVIGPRELKQSNIEVNDTGFEVVNISSLRAGEYTIRVTLGSEVYTGTFKKALYGR